MRKYFKKDLLTYFNCLKKTTTKRLGIYLHIRWNFGLRVTRFASIPKEEQTLLIHFLCLDTRAILDLQVPNIVVYHVCTSCFDIESNVITTDLRGCTETGTETPQVCYCVKK